MEKKQETKLEQLCKGFPDCFPQYIRYSRGLEFDEKPDYDLCKSFFKNAMEYLNFDNDFLYDWSSMYKR